MENKVKLLLVYKQEDRFLIESVWVDEENGNYRIRNIPFYAANIAYGDLVRAENDEGELYFEDLIEASGHSTIQILILDETRRKEIIKKVESIHCSWEESDLHNYIGVDVPPEVDYQDFKKYLDLSMEKGYLDYKEACLAQ